MKRPQIYLGSTGLICIDNCTARVVIAKDKISVGCTDITPQAAKVLVDNYNKLFPESSSKHILQDGFDGVSKG